MNRLSVVLSFLGRQKDVIVSVSGLLLSLAAFFVALAANKVTDYQNKIMEIQSSPLIEISTTYTENELSSPIEEFIVNNKGGPARNYTLSISSKIYFAIVKSSKITAGEKTAKFPYTPSKKGGVYTVILSNYYEGDVPHQSSKTTNEILHLSDKIDFKKLANFSAELLKLSFNDKYYDLGSVRIKTCAESIYIDIFNNRHTDYQCAVTAPYSSDQKYEQKIFSVEEEESGKKFFEAGYPDSKIGAENEDIIDIKNDIDLSKTKAFFERAKYWIEANPEKSQLLY